MTLEALAADQRFDSQIALLREHWGAVRHLWIDTPDPLRVARLGRDLPHDFWIDCGMPGLAPIRPTRDGRFEFADNGRLAVIVPAYDGLPGLLDANAEHHIEHLVDLIAIDVSHADRFWRRRGHALVLGAGFLDIADQDGAPVPVFRNPLTWLRSGAAGIVVLDWDWAWDLLLGFGLIAEDIALGTRLETALAPSILVMDAA